MSVVRMVSSRLVAPQSRIVQPTRRAVLRSLAAAAVIGAVAPATLAACGGTEETADPVRKILEDGGVPMHDAGGVSLDGDLFSGVEISSGATGFDIFQEIASFKLTSGWITAKGLQDENLVAAYGTNSSWIPNMPNDACLPDLINTKQLSEEDIALMEEYNAQHPDEPIFIGCADEAYYTWETCPTNLNNRAHLYLGKVTTWCYDWNGEGYVPIGGPRVFTGTIEADLEKYNPFVGNTTDEEGNPLTITPLGIICGVYDLKAGQKPDFVAPNYVGIPADCYSNGSLYMEQEVELFVDVRHISQVLAWLAYFEGWVQIQ